MLIAIAIAIATATAIAIAIAIAKAVAIARSSDHIIRSAHHHFVHSLRLTLGDMYANQVPKNHQNGPERGPGGSVWAQTLSKRRPEAQDHFPSPPGPQNPIKKLKKPKIIKIPSFTVQNHPLYIETPDKPLKRLICYD